MDGKVMLSAGIALFFYKTNGNVLTVRRKIDII